jgi:hypothetical protein
VPARGEPGDREPGQAKEGGGPPARLRGPARPRRRHMQAAPSTAGRRYRQPCQPGTPGTSPARRRRQRPARRVPRGTGQDPVPPGKAPLVDRAPPAGGWRTRSPCRCSTVTPTLTRAAAAMAAGTARPQRRFAAVSPGSARSAPGTSAGTTAATRPADPASATVAGATPAAVATMIARALTPRYTVVGHHNRMARHCIHQFQRSPCA